MQQPGGLDRILHKIRDNVKGSFEKIKDKVNESLKYLDERLEEIGNTISTKFKEYMPIFRDAAIAASPLYVKVPILTGLQIKNLYKGTRGKLLGYGLIAGSIVASGLGIFLGLNAIHSLPSNHIQYLGSGYIAFEPNGQTINYNGHPDPEGYLIFYSKSNDTTIEIPNVIWDGQYASTIIQNHNQIVQLNKEFVGQTDPINNQPYVPLQDFYVIDGPAPVKQAIIDGQTYYVIEANKINPADIAGFYTYQGWVTNFVTAMNTPGTYAAGLPGNSPVFQWTNTTGTVAYQTIVYQHYIRGSAGGTVLVLPNGTIISYGASAPYGSALFNFTTPQQSYNPSS
jgi:hypothetical protein